MKSLLIPTNKSVLEYCQEQLRILQDRQTEQLARMNHLTDDMLALERLLIAYVKQIGAGRTQRRTIAQYMELLFQAQKRPLLVKEIERDLRLAGLLRGVNRDTVYNVLSRHRDKFKRVGHGRYTMIGIGDEKTLDNLGEDATLEAVGER